MMEYTNKSQYTPYINPVREAAREKRDEARGEALQKAGVCSDPIREMLGLSDVEYCYYLKTGSFMVRNGEG